MEMIKANVFYDMSCDEMEKVQGGWWGIALGIFAIAAGYNELYDLGYKIGSWFR